MTLLKEHIAQVLNYLYAGGMDVGLLVNFGTPRLEYRRLERKARGRGKGEESEI